MEVECWFQKSLINRCRDPAFSGEEWGQCYVARLLPPWESPSLAEERKRSCYDATLLDACENQMLTEAEQRSCQGRSLLDSHERPEHSRDQIRVPQDANSVDLRAPYCFERKHDELVLGSQKQRTRQQRAVSFCDRCMQQSRSTQTVTRSKFMKQLHPFRTLYTAFPLMHLFIPFLASISLLLTKLSLLLSQHPPLHPT